jgi:hypothetical protein
MVLQLYDARLLRSTPYSVLSTATIGIRVSVFFFILSASSPQSPNASPIRTLTHSLTPAFLGALVQSDIRTKGNCIKVFVVLVHG